MCEQKKDQNNVKPIFAVEFASITVNSSFKHLSIDFITIFDLTAYVLCYVDV